MNKSLRIVGAIVAGMAIIAVVLYGLGSKAVDKSKRNAEIYADQALGAILPTWNAKALLARGASEFLQKNLDTEIQRNLRELQGKLGKLKKAEPSHCTTITTIQDRGRAEIVGMTITQATFEKGRAEIDLMLVRDPVDWKIARFYVNASGKRETF